MRLRTLFALAVALLLPALAHANGYTHRDIVLSSAGRPVAGATISVCAASGTWTATTICSPVTTTIYTDYTLGTTKANPTTSDGRGNFEFSVPFGTAVVVSISGSRITTFSYVVTPTQPTTFTDFDCVEAAAISGAANHDVMYCDSTAHRVKVNNNNGGADTPAVFTDKLNVFAATTSAELAAVLSDETGSGGGFVRATSPTLTGLNLTNAANGHTVSLLCPFQGASSAVTGTGAIQNIYSCAITANVLAAGKGIRIYFGFSHSTGSASNLVSITVGGTTSTEVGCATTAAARCTATWAVFNNPGVQTSQVLVGNSADSGSSTGNTQDTAAVNFANGITITANVHVANTDQNTPKYFWAELIQ